MSAIDRVLREAVNEAGAIGFLRGREQVIEQILQSDEAIDAAARQIDAYIPMTAGNRLVAGAAFRDALVAAVDTLASDESGSPDASA